MHRNVVRNRRYDDFKDDRFSSEVWSAPSLTLPQEIRARIDSFALCGRKIKRMQMIGLSYAHQGISIENTAYGQLMHLPESERERRSSYHNVDDEIVFTRWTEIDEPFMIGFEDGDVFEIDIPWESVFRMSMNRIPWCIEYEVNIPNLEADVLFSNCIGQTITAVDLNPVMLTYDPNNLHSFDEAPYEREFVSEIVLRLEDGTALRFYGRDDFCEVDCIDADDEVLTIRYGELKEGLFNWEDFDIDKVTGFEAESGMVFFNEKGEDRMGTIYLTLFSSGCRESRAYISDDDVLLLAWCIAKASGEPYDECSSYHLSCEEWSALLDYADRLLRAETADALIGQLEAYGYMTNYRGRDGAKLWESREKYREQAEDLRKWSELVLKQGDTMHICGI